MRAAEVLLICVAAAVALARIVGRQLRATLPSVKERVAARRRQASGEAAQPQETAHDHWPTAAAAAAACAAAALWWRRAEGASRPQAPAPAAEAAAAAGGGAAAAAAPPPASRSPARVPTRKLLASSFSPCSSTAPRGAARSPSPGAGSPANRARAAQAEEALRGLRRRSPSPGEELQPRRLFEAA
eukprot:TRINITY_DN27574_c0_g1_i1.p2 TRINITY_DN27574_c0_g1~~TRINITY_DN27574_c0_g1_i1.p2  ORF type:complete len:186 (+),score=42.98 TRINITY_DN27574_c0_g1_i1:80-637(+)